MANVHISRVRGNMIFWDTHRARWIDGIGPGVRKFVDDFVKTGLASADAPSDWTVTLVEGGAGESTVALEGGADGGLLLITTDAAENDGVNMQAKGEAFTLSLTTAAPCAFSCRLKVSDATQSDFLVGLCITDTDLLGGMTDGAYFRKVDGSATVSAVLEKNATETTGTAHTMVDDAFVWLEMYFDGAVMHFYVNGAEITALAQTNLPDDEYLTPSIHFLTGEAVAKTMRVDRISAIQVLN